MNNTCCFSGHRKIPACDLERVLQNLKRETEKLIKQGVNTFISGGAIGFDTMAASMVIILRNNYPHIKLVLALPCNEQTKYWHREEIDLYNDLLKEADEIIYVSEHYYKGCMHVRNRFMVDNSSYCICYLTEARGGTSFTVNYAKRKGLTVINV